jgi:negative regulator of sigma E activity
MYLQDYRINNLLKSPNLESSAEISTPLKWLPESFQKVSKFPFLL